MKFNELCLLLEGREGMKGPSLKDQGNKNGFVTILRAKLESSGTTFEDMDFVTMSPRFALEHAQHIFAVEEEPSIIIKAIVSTDQVFNAPNPGEYFYCGPSKKGKVVKRINSFEE